MRAPASKLKVQLLQLPLLPLLLLVAVGCEQVASATRDSNWQFPMAGPAAAASELEREGTSSLGRQQLLLQQQQQQQQQQQLFRSPVDVGRQLSELRAHLLSRNNGRLPDNVDVRQLRQTDQFQCVEPSRALYEEFKRQYNRTFKSTDDEFERAQWFRATIKRAIHFNRIVQDEVLRNFSNKFVCNFHFIEPQYGDTNLALWYADITDCELGLLKYNLFRVFNFIDEDQLKLAYEIVREQSVHLAALTTDDGLEQLAEILLVRLFDRLQHDKRMDQLFRWPEYLKKLAAYAYSQQQAQQPDFKTKLALVSFAYPTYFKDVKYNFRAVNRTNDNVRANREHVEFNARHGRNFKDLAERNRRLVLFRQRWTLVSQLNGEPPEGANSTRHLLPEWLRASTHHPGGQEEHDLHYEVDGEPGTSGGEAPTSGKLIRSEEGDESWTSAAPGTSGRPPFRLTQFSDLTDQEFQAFLSNDYSLLDNVESQEFLRRNFPVRPLDARHRWEVARELELRRGTSLSNNNLELLRRGGQLLVDEQRRELRPAGEPSPSLMLAKQVVDELISEVGLPVGPVRDDIGEDEHVRVFQRVAAHWQKPYTFSDNLLGILSLADERTKRFQQFKENLGRFRAWFKKRGLRLDEAREVAMLRLADLSWHEIKLSLFKVCCLTSENLNALSATSATLQYLGSHYKLLCEQMWPQVGGAQPYSWSSASASAPLPGNSISAKLQQQQQQRPQVNVSEEAERSALELYYYYLVHFNKHHASQAEAQRRFGIFRRNVDAIRRHSCKRSLALFEGLRRNASELLNTIDVLDPRRSFMDDLNLDRFEFFSLPLAGAPTQRDLVPMPAKYTASGAAAAATSSRAGLSYRRDFLAPLWEARAPTGPSGSSVAYSADSYQFNANARLQDSWQDANESAQKYRENNVASVYELVMSRYKLCMKTTSGIELDSYEPRNVCKTNGVFGDQTAQLSPRHEFLAQQHQQQQQQRDACAFYFQGLDSWAEDLIPQPALVATSILEAKC